MLDNVHATLYDLEQYYDFGDGFLKSTAALVTNNSDGITITIF